MQQVIHLKDIINIEAFQKIQDDIANATGVAIITTDYKGKPITNHSFCTKFCSIVRSNDKYAELCEKCDSRGGLEAAGTGKPYIYICHKGLIDFAVPIVVQDQYLGSLMAGQVLIEESETRNLEKVIQVDTNIEYNTFLLDSYKELQTIPLKKIKDIAQMMFHIGNYIVEDGVLRIAECELNDKDSIITETKKTQVMLETELKKVQLKVLQPQIDQHFLFNILNNIYSLALIENAPKTQELACDLSEMLRYTIENSNQVVTLKEEVEYILLYLRMQKIRFGERLEFIIDIKDKFRGIKFPFMMLYSLVKNSISSSLDSKRDVTSIKIAAYELDNHTFISILDNREDDLDEDSFSVSINNARQRMKNLYGSNYSIDTYILKNKGREVKIKLPKKYGQEMQCV